MIENAFCICLDAEFVEGDELIELSILALDRTQIYSQRFNPARYSKWDSSIHHITPAMVENAPSFESCRDDIQSIVDRASHIMGFAVDNDITHLSRQGITGLDGKFVIELRDWFWINHGMDNGLDLFQGISLERVTQELETGFGAGGMHSASGDTMATLDCFHKLYEKFCHTRALTGFAFGRVVEKFNDEYSVRKEEYDRTHAEGYALLIRCGDDGYSLRVRREEPEPSPKIAACIHVADRKRAEVELNALISRRQSPAKGIYKLLPRDIEAFKSYTNGFSVDEHALFNKLSKLQSRFNVTSIKHR